MLHGKKVGEGCQQRTPKFQVLDLLMLGLTRASEIAGPPQHLGEQIIEMSPTLTISEYRVMDGDVFFGDASVSPEILRLFGLKIF